MTDEVEIHTNLDSLEADWRELAKRVSAPPFLWPGWVAAWWNSFGTSELTTLSARQGDRLVAVMPLVRRGPVIASPTNWHSPIYGLVAEGHGADAVTRALFESAPRRVSLSFLMTSGSGLNEIRAACTAAGYRLAERTIMRSPYLKVGGTWDEYWSGRSRNLRKGIRRLRNRLEDIGEVSIEVTDGRAGLEQLLEKVFRIEASGWKGEKGTAILSQPETRRFYEQVAAWAAAEGILKVALLRVNGRAVAMHLALESDGRYYMLKTGYDVAFKQAGPGRLLDYEMASRAFSEGLKSFEFLGADEPYKLDWANGVHERVVLQAFAPSAAGSLEWLVQSRGRAIARRILARRR